MIVKNNLEDIRLEMKIKTQKEFAEKVLDMRQEAYSRMANQGQQTTLARALYIAKKLNRPVEDIFYIASE